MIVDYEHGIPKIAILQIGPKVLPIVCKKLIRTIPPLELHKEDDVYVFESKKFISSLQRSYLGFFTPTVTVGYKFCPK